MVVRENPQKIGTLYKLNLENTIASLSLDKKGKKISINKDNTTQSVEYNLSDKTSTFKTTLTFKSSMNEKQCKQEFNKINNLKLVYATIANIAKSDISESISYFDKVLSANTSSTDKFTSPIEYAKEMSKKDLNIQDKLFTLTTQTTQNTNDKYTIGVTLSVNNSALFNTSSSETGSDTNSDSNSNSDYSSNKTSNSSKKVISSTNKLPQTGHFINIKYILMLTIFLAIIAIVYLKIKGTNNEQKR